MQRLRRAWRRAARYVREDLREIVAPRPMPDPPDLPPLPPRQTWRQFVQARPPHALCQRSLC